jgi:hypothetical protein
MFVLKSNRKFSANSFILLPETLIVDYFSDGISHHYNWIKMARNNGLFRARERIIMIVQLRIYKILKKRDMKLVVIESFDNYCVDWCRTYSHFRAGRLWQCVGYQKKLFSDIDFNLIEVQHRNLVIKFSKKRKIKFHV